MTYRKCFGYRKVESIMFNFRIIDMADGNQIIDRHLKRPYNALTAVQMIEYVEMDAQLELMDRMKQKARKEASRRRRIARNPLYRLALVCGLV